MNYVDSIKYNGVDYPIRDNDAVHTEEFEEHVEESFDTSMVVNKFKTVLRSIVNTDTTLQEIIINTVLEANYPPHTILITADNNNPGDRLPGVWRSVYAGKFLVGFDPNDPDFDSTSVNNGEKSVKLNVTEMPAHKHDVTGGSHSHTYQYAERARFQEDGNGSYHHSVSDYSSRNTSATSHTHTVSNVGGGQPHNNLPPYQVVYFWERIA